ncbi:lysylphosphatidylglycerol synthase domain-containing protein [Tamlana sedimenti]|uniref:lysylphosphatidylglycerol synthase domain-containing protein n=1 Tax=Tamlana sedimenti TaxID=3134126 RepID=UPI00403ED899
MLFSLPYKTKQFFFVLIKLSIVVGAFYFIYEKLTNNHELKLSVFVDLVSKSKVFSLKSIVFLLILSIFNWFFEILKWQTLVAPIKRISLKTAAQQSLGSLTASLITPNRIGEYGAKALSFVKDEQKKILLINFIGNMLQMGVTVLLGATGLYFFIKTYNPEINYLKLSRLLFIALAIIALIGFGFTKSRFTIKGVPLEKLKSFLLKFPKKNLLKGGLFSFLRYGLFSFQFYFLLQTFVVDFGYIQAMTFITSMYLLASIIPSIFIFDVVIKGSIAVYLFSLAGVNEVVILSIITIMWLFNFVLPSIVGSYFVLNFKLPKKHQYS